MDINVVDILSIYESHSTFDVYFTLTIKEGPLKGGREKKCLKIPF